jgi:hypothetical protein
MAVMFAVIKAIHFWAVRLRKWLWGFIGIKMAYRMSSHAFQNVDDEKGNRITRFKM